MKKKDKTMLLWVGGLAALYFLTRSKTPAQPIRKNTSTANNFPQAQPSSPAAPASAMGLPYTYNAEI